MPRKVGCDVFVVFGITGDLAKVMTFRSLYRLEHRGLLDCPIVGVAFDDWSDKDLRDHARAAIKAAGEKIDAKVFDRLAKRFSYVQGDFADEEAYERVAKQIQGSRSPVFYLEIPPQINLDMGFGEQGGEGPTPYEVLPHGAMQRDRTRFTRQESVERTWRIVDPLLTKPPKIHPYKPGSWGPKAADRLVADHGGWHGPWTAA